MSTRIRDMAKSSAEKVFGILGAHQLKQLKSFVANDFVELLELQKRSMQWLITAMQTHAELRTSEPRTIVDVSISVMLKLRVWQLRN